MSVREVERWSAFKVWVFSLMGSNPKSNLVAVERLGLTPTDRFLDVGCGLGAALEHALDFGAEVAGIDPSPAMVGRAGRRIPAAEIRVGSAEEIPFADARFTAACAVSTYHHWADHDAGLAEVRRVMSPGGRFLVLERRLRRGSGHGLSRSESDRLASDAVAAGFASAQVDTTRVGRMAFLAVTAIA